MINPQLLMGFASLLFGGLISAIVTFYLNARRNERGTQRAKLEELFKAFYSCTTSLGAFWMPYTSAMAGRISYAEAEEIFIQNPVKLTTLPDIEMLATIYFPQLEPYFNRLIDIRNSANDCIFRFKHDSKINGRHESEEFHRIGEISKSLSQLQREFIQAVRETASDLN